MTEKLMTAEEALVRSKSPGQVRAMFDAISPTYDYLNHLLSMNIDRRWRKFAAQELITRDVHNVLDVCSGTGDLVLAFAKRAKQIGGKTRFISADFTPSMTRLAKRKFRAAGEVDVQTTVADTMQLPYGDSTFDLVSVAFGIRNVSDIRAGLNEMVRVCRPGGSVAVLEFSHPRNPLFRALYNFYFFSVLPRIGRIISGSKAYLYLPKSVAKFPDTPEFMRILSEAAGQQAKSRRLTFGIATLYHVRIAKQT